MDFEIWIDADLDKPVTFDDREWVFFQGDIMPTLICIRTHRNGENVYVSGSVKVRVILPNGSIRIDSGINLRNGVIYAWLQERSLSMPGPITVIIKVGDITVAALKGTVYQTITDNVIGED